MVDKNSKIIVGKFGKPFGIKGWLKIHSFTHPPTNILTFTPWLISRDQKNWSKLEGYEGEMKGQNIIARPINITTPEDAKIYTNQLIAINREELPKLADNDFYWIDLVGLDVINTKGIALGQVDHLIATCSNDVLVVKSIDKIKKKKKERLIPYLSQVVLEVNLAANTILVAWDEDF